MNTVGPILKSASDMFNDLTIDPVHKDYGEFVGPVAGKGWHTRSLQIQIDKVDENHDDLKRRFQESPVFGDVVKDNTLRLTLLSGMERLISLRQGLGSLKIGAGTSFKNSDMAALNAILQQNPLKGYFRGAALNFLQFCGTGFHTMLYTWNQGLVPHIVYSSIFEAFFYPLDTVKTLMYNDIGGSYKNVFDCIGKTVAQNGLGHFYQGIHLKLIYNACFVWHLRNWYDESALQALSIPLWIGSYAFLTVKTKVQIAGTAIAHHDGAGAVRSLGKTGAFNGVVPFVLLNTLFSWQFYCFYSKERQQSMLDEVLEGYELFNNPMSQ